MDVLDYISDGKVFVVNVCCFVVRNFGNEENEPNTLQLLQATPPFPLLCAAHGKPVSFA